ncbi:hypothetical protein BKA70DRAFT_1256728 [Coprinopsis sp. MPI-PUGE-AT-0042]|nr:hypothetical protein BKA70DRAFT_1256728 [Coprinopsis sp. MPI-PUGE-AT-0042]
MGPKATSFFQLQRHCLSRKDQRKRRIRLDSAQLGKQAIEPWWGLPTRKAIQHHHDHAVDCVTSGWPPTVLSTSGSFPNQETHVMDASNLRNQTPKKRKQARVSFASQGPGNIGLRPNLTLKSSVSVVNCPSNCSFSATGNLSLSSSPLLSIGGRLRLPGFRLRPEPALGLWKRVQFYSHSSAPQPREEDEEAEEERVEEATKVFEEIRVDFSAMKLEPDFGPNNNLWPPLPDIRDRAIERQIFTHRSFYARPTLVFEDHPTDLSPDNERYEHLGDTVLGLVVTNLMFDMFPGLRVGPSTKIRSLVVGNFTLADISKRYKLPDRLWLHSAQAVTLRASTNIQADVFEAFVGGLYRDQGLVVVQQWLVPLFRPFAKVGYDYVRKQHTLPPLPPSPANVPNGSNHATMNGHEDHGAAEYFGGPTRGHLALFNQQLQRTNRQIEWIYSDGSDPSMAGDNSMGHDTFFDHPASAPLVAPTTSDLVCADPSAEEDAAHTSISANPTAAVKSLPNSPEARSANGNGNNRRYNDPGVPAHLRIKGTTLTPVWYVKVLVDGEFYGRGRGNTKKAARNEAAKEGLVKLGINV